MNQLDWTGQQGRGAGGSGADAIGVSVETIFCSGTVVGTLEPLVQAVEMSASTPKNKPTNTAVAALYVAILVVMVKCPNYRKSETQGPAVLMQARRLENLCVSLELANLDRQIEAERTRGVQAADRRWVRWVHQTGSEPTERRCAIFAATLNGASVVLNFSRAGVIEIPLIQ
jgi:hypothetical protein